MRFLVYLMAALLGLPAVGSAELPRAMPAVGGAQQLPIPAAESAVAGLRAPATGVAGHYRAPVDGPTRVLRGYSPPATPYGPGHLGVDLAVAGGGVLAAGSGTVRFAGQVAGRGVVVLQHPDGVSTEYEPIDALVRSGERVVEGQPIGRLAGTHRGCPVPACLHWGARRGGEYLDPMSLLRPLGVVRLLPWDWLPAALTVAGKGASGSGSGMGLFEAAAQPVDRDVGVDLRGGQAGMPE